MWYFFSSSPAGATPGWGTSLPTAPEILLGIVKVAWIQLHWTIRINSWNYFLTSMYPSHSEEYPRPQYSQWGLQCIVLKSPVDCMLSEQSLLPANNVNLHYLWIFLILPCSAVWRCCCQYKYHRVSTRTWLSQTHQTCWHLLINYFLCLNLQFYSTILSLGVVE